jgi:hypothetical protein
MDCAECGTDHSDHWPGSIGEKLACLGAQREAFRVDAARYLRGKDRKARAYHLLGVDVDEFLLRAAAAELDMDDDDVIGLVMLEPFAR